METRNIIRAGTLALFALSAPLLAACEEEGPAEQAGEAIDNAVEDSAEAVEDVAE